VDYGCGSGILGIAGKLLGAKECFSTDIDPQAIYATEQNAERNHVSIHASLPETFKPSKAKVVLSNILSGPLVELAPILGNLVEPGDRKSTRLNSSHVSISYAVFCLKKKNKGKSYIRSYAVHN